MRQEIKLYIGNQEVEFSTPPEILYNYTLTDLKNPTIIKNSYSKTITIEGTPKNNQLFGSIWNLERIQAYNGGSTGPSFNPLQKADFKIYVNGDLYESGYVKLTNITKTGRNIEYQVNLFGGLGQFFYNLSYTHNEAGETEGPDKLQLKDLAYVGEGYQPDDGDWVQDFNFVINKETIFDAWNTMYGDGSQRAKDYEADAHRPDSYWYNKKWKEYINFIPTAYNGIPENFDAEHVVINRPQDFNGAFSATTMLGYALATAPTALTQEQTLDCRSYLQRPIIRMKAIFDAIALPENNGGYEVIYGDHFFNGGNSYYWDAWMTLPMLKDMEIDKTTDYTITGATISSSGSTAAKVNFTQPTGTTLNNFQVTIDVRYTLNSTPSYYPEKLFTDTYYTGEPNLFSSDVKWYKKRGTQMLQLIAYDATNTPIAESNVILLQSTKYDGNDLDNGYSKYKDYWNAVYPSNVDVPATEVRTGCYRRESGNVYYWTEGAATSVGNRGVTFTFSEPMQNFHYLVLKHLHPANDKYKERGGNGSGNYGTDTIGLYSSMRTKSTLSQSLSQVRARDNYKGDYSFAVLNFNAEATAYDNFFSNTKITKDKLLATDNTPAEYLINYCKLFGLYFYRDAAEQSSDPETYPNGVIHILDRAEFYKMASDYGEDIKPEIINLDKMIDRSKPISITPQLPETKWYNFNVEQLETDAEKRYFDTYEVPLGLKRVNTGYNFDAEATDVYKDNIFRGAPQVMEKCPNYYITALASSSGNWVSYADKIFNEVREGVALGATRREYDIVWWHKEGPYDTGSSARTSVYCRNGHIDSAYTQSNTRMRYNLSTNSYYHLDYSDIKAWEEDVLGANNLYWSVNNGPIMSFDGGAWGNNKQGHTSRDTGPFYIYNGLKYSDYGSSNEKIPTMVWAYKYAYNSGNTGYDMYPRLQLHGDDNKAIDGDGVLVFGGWGNKMVGSDVRSNASATYWISDDFHRMGQLNNGEPCWLLTKSGYGNDGVCIAYPQKVLPYFTRTLTNDETHYNTLSWDFGNSQEVFIPDVYNTDEQGIYYRMWRDYITDLYSVNNRKLTCSVLLKEKPNPDWLRRFYWFDNSIWSLNKIKDWSVSTYDSTEMEFIKVQDYKNYNLQQITECGLLNILFDVETYPWDDVETTGRVTISDGSDWYFFSDNPVTGEYIDGTPVYIDYEEPEIYLTPSHGSGLTTNFTLYTGENENAKPRRFIAHIEGCGDANYYGSVLQEGNGDPYVALYCDRTDRTIELMTPAAKKIEIPVYMGGGINTYRFEMIGDMIERYEYTGDELGGVLSIWVFANTDEESEGRTASVYLYGEDGVHPMVYMSHVTLSQPSPAFEINPSALTWNYNETNGKSVTFTPHTYEDGRYGCSISDPDNAFIINFFSYGSLSVYPKEQNDTDYDHVATITISNGIVTHEVQLTQHGDPPATSAQVWWATGNKGNDDFYQTGGTGSSLGAFAANGRVYFDSTESYGHVTMVGSSQFRVSCDRNNYGAQRDFTILCRSSKTGQVLAYHRYYQGR